MSSYGSYYSSGYEDEDDYYEDDDFPAYGNAIVNGSADYGGACIVCEDAISSHVVLVLDNSKSMASSDVDNNTTSRKSAVIDCCKAFLSSQVSSGASYKDKYTVVLFNDNSTTVVKGASAIGPEIRQVTCM